MSNASMAGSDQAVASSLQDASRQKRLLAYLAERFPLGPHGLLILSFYSSNHCLAHVLTHARQPVVFGPRAIMGYFVVFCIFLHLRIFDDHKDYEEDCRYFPERVLQSGIVTLRDLKWVAAWAVFLELTLSAIAGPGPFVSVTLALGFTLLMLKEFFARDWLKRHLLVYVLSHMCIMPLLAMVIFSFAVASFLWQAPRWQWLYALVGFFVALSWEVSRKIRAPDDEIDGVDSYTKLFGTYGAAYLVLIIRVVDTSLVVLLAHHLRLSTWFYGWLIFMFLVCLIGFFQYRFHTTTATARRLATYAGFYIVAFDIGLTIELVRTNGIAWRGLE